MNSNLARRGAHSPKHCFGHRALKNMTVIQHVLVKSLGASAMFVSTLIKTLEPYSSAPGI